jgi:hypothetical protein
MSNCGNAITTARFRITAGGCGIAVGDDTSAA